MGGGKKQGREEKETFHHDYQSVDRGGVKCAITRRPPQACIYGFPGQRSPRMSAHVPWIRSNGFLLALIGAVILAFLVPEGGGSGAWIPPVLVTNGGIALILFFQGLSLAFAKVKAGAGNWRLHLVIQAFTFGV
ncbi:MAG: hypothetical protein EOP87_23520, partial [Verrucomicrobiaceae bacterium]